MIFAVAANAGIAVEAQRVTVAEPSRDPRREAQHGFIFIRGADALAHARLADDAAGDATRPIPQLVLDHGRGAGNNRCAIDGKLVVRLHPGAGDEGGEALLIDLTGHPGKAAFGIAIEAENAVAEAAHRPEGEIARFEDIPGFNPRRNGAARRVGAQRGRADKAGIAGDLIEIIHPGGGAGVDVPSVREERGVDRAAEAILLHLAKATANLTVAHAVAERAADEELAAEAIIGADGNGGVGVIQRGFGRTAVALAPTVVSGNEDRKGLILIAALGCAGQG